jgi:hypothetical protein
MLEWFNFFDEYDNTIFSELSDSNDPSNEPCKFSDDEPDHCINNLSDEETEPAEPMALTNHCANQQYWEGSSRLESVLTVLDVMLSHQLNLPLLQCEPQ